MQFHAFATTLAPQGEVVHGMRATSDWLVRGIVVASSLVTSTMALATEPRMDSEPFLTQEPAELTNVVDAFDDDDDPFDIHISLGFQHTWKNSTIQRETTLSAPEFSSGGYTASTLNVAKYSESTSRLLTRADIGLYKDIALVVRMPIILSNDRNLTGLDGSDAQQRVTLQGAPGEQLFTLPFNSPTRSGIEYLAFGAEFGILNQYRDVTKPTWVLGLEGRFNVSDPMKACNANTTYQCTYPNDINRDGPNFAPITADRTTGQIPGSGADAISLNGGPSGTRGPGVSRGTHALELHTYLSKRIKYVEPYGGISALFEFAAPGSEFGNATGSLVNHPPFEGSMVLGTEIIPWEAIDNKQRVSFDLRFRGTYRSEGRDYSELFDALGSSPAASLRHPNFSTYQNFCEPALCGAQFPEGVPSVINPDSDRVYTTGITNVQQHGRYTFAGAVAWHAGEFVRFKAGGAFTAVQGHAITSDQACNPSFVTSQAASGPCQSYTADPNAGATLRVTGIPNPNYRSVINSPGRRFIVDGSGEFDLFIRASVTF